MSTTAHILNPLTWIRVARNSGGYGVHSPFAYRFITEVLRQEYGYYCYSRLGDPTLRTIFRIVNHLRPAVVEIRGEKAIGAAVHFAGSVIRTGKVKNPELMIVQGNAADADTIAGRIADGCAVILLEPATDFRSESLGACMSFANVFANSLAASQPMAVIVPRADFTRQHFDLLF